MSSSPILSLAVSVFLSFAAAAFLWLTIKAWLRMRSEPFVARVLVLIGLGESAYCLLAVTCFQILVLASKMNWHDNQPITNSTEGLVTAALLAPMYMAFIFVPLATITSAEFFAAGRLNDFRVGFPYTMLSCAALLIFILLSR